jgi:hypothetical protein
MNPKIIQLLEPPRYTGLLILVNVANMIKRKRTSTTQTATFTTYWESIQRETLTTLLDSKLDAWPFNVLPPLDCDLDKYLEKLNQDPDIELLIKTLMEIDGLRASHTRYVEDMHYHQVEHEKFDFGWETTLPIPDVDRKTANQPIVRAKKMIKKIKADLVGLEETILTLLEKHSCQK